MWTAESGFFFTSVLGFVASASGETVSVHGGWGGGLRATVTSFITPLFPPPPLPQPIALHHA